MSVPSWWAVLLLIGASWRTWRLIALDEITWPLRDWLLKLDGWRKDGDPVPLDFRRRLGEFLECPYCFGFWIAVAWWIAWEISAKWTEIAATPFAISVGVIALTRLLEKSD